MQSLLTRWRRFSILFGKVMRNFKRSLLCITSGMWSLAVRIYVAVYHVYFFVPNNRRIECSLMNRAIHNSAVEVLLMTNVFINRPCSTKLAIGMLDEPWSLTSKDGLRAYWAKIKTHNNKRNNNFMIFQKLRWKLINNLFWESPYKLNPVITLDRNWSIRKQRIFLRGLQEREAI